MIAQKRRSHPGQYQDIALIELFQPAQPGSPDSLRPVHTVQSTLRDRAIRSGQSAEGVGTSGSPGCRDPGHGLPHLAPWAAAVRIRNATSGVQGAGIDDAGVPHLAVGWAWAGLARALQTRSLPAELPAESPA